MYRFSAPRIARPTVNHVPTTLYPSSNHPCGHALGLSKWPRSHPSSLLTLSPLPPLLFSHLSPSSSQPLSPSLSPQPHLPTPTLPPSRPSPLGHALSSPGLAQRERMSLNCTCSQASAAWFIITSAALSASSLATCRKHSACTPAPAQRCTPLHTTVQRFPAVCTNCAHRSRLCAHRCPGHGPRGHQGFWLQGGETGLIPAGVSSTCQCSWRSHSRMTRGMFMREK